MHNPTSETGSKAGISEMLNHALAGLERAGFHSLNFPRILEDRFEAELRKARSYRMWFEGLIAILVLNACLILDFVMVQDIAWLSVVRHTAIVTPFALLINMLVYTNPVRWLREGSVAVAMVVICWMNLFVEGNTSTSGTLFGSICVLITALFVGVVMRLRFLYAVSSVLAMLPAGLWYLSQAHTMHVAERVVGSSLMLVGTGIILVASYSLEREERRNYLLCLQRDLQTAELASTNAALQRLSSVDKLTGLPNRRAMEERIERMWHDCARTGSSMSIVLVDVDHFKLVNDVYGHLFGDETLRRIGTLLSQALRSPNDMAARFGGEEFVILLANAEPDLAMTVAERARQLVEAAGTPLNTDPSGEAMMWITVSCGVSSCMPNPELKWADLIAASDEALYGAKHAGRNRVEYRLCNPQPQTEMNYAEESGLHLRNEALVSRDTR